MNKQACREQLTNLLKTHLAHIDLAIDYLASIKQAIGANRIDAMQQSLQQPEFSIDGIERLEHERHQLLTDFGFKQDQSGFKDCIAWCDDDGGALTEMYQQLIDRLLQLQRSIQVNSLLVSRGKERLRRSVGILTGHGNPDNCQTYDDKGETLGNANRRNIAIA